MGDVLLVGYQIWDDVERQLKLACPSNYHPLLLIHVGTDDVAIGEPGTHEELLQSSMHKGRSPGDVFLDPKGKRLGRNGQFLQINVWLNNWYPRQHLGFYDHGTLSSNEGY